MFVKEIGRLLYQTLINIGGRRVVERQLVHQSRDRRERVVDLELVRHERT